MKNVRLSLPLTEAMKNVKAYIAAFRHASSDMERPRLRHDRRLALLSHLNLILNLCTLSFFLSLDFLPHLPPLLTSPTVPDLTVPGSRLRSSPITRDLTFLSPGQRPCVAERKATFLTLAEPRALRSVICPFAPLLSAELLATSPCPLPLA